MRPGKKELGFPHWVPASHLGKPDETLSVRGMMTGVALHVLGIDSLAKAVPDYCQISYNFCMIPLVCARNFRYSDPVGGGVMCHSLAAAAVLAVARLHRPC